MKLEYLTGLRGMAAVGVVMYHVFFIFLPAAIVENNAVHHLSGNIENVLVSLPQFFYNGNFAVCIFFVLSGFVLSFRFWQQRDSGLLSMAACKRYIRLTGPVIASVLLAYILLRSGYIYNHEIAKAASSVPLVNEMYSFAPGLVDALKEAFWGVYFSYNQVESYNPVLWTMEIELKGSFLSLAFLALFGKVRYRGVIYVIFAAVCLKTYYLAFVLGLLLSDLVYSTEGRLYWQCLHRYKWFNRIVSFLALYLGSYTLEGHHIFFEMIFFKFFNRMHFDSVAFYHIVGSALLVYAVLQLQGLQKFFSWAIWEVLGKYSFAIYLVHIPILCSVGGSIFLYFMQHGYSYGGSVLAGVGCCLPIIALASIGMDIYVDRPSRRAAICIYEKLKG